eukprot:scaffold6039_cov64-Phaeocystis_antarctica.AAC.1
MRRHHRGTQGREQTGRVLWPRVGVPPSLELGRVPRPVPVGSTRRRSVRAYWHRSSASSSATPMIVPYESKGGGLGRRALGGGVGREARTSRPALTVGTIGAQEGTAPGVRGEGCGRTHQRLVCSVLHLAVLPALEARVACGVVTDEHLG